MENLGDKTVTKKGQKGAEKGKSFYCSICDYECCKQYSWDRHILTSKHMKVTKGDAEVTEKGQKGQIKNLRVKIVIKIMILETDYGNIKVNVLIMTKNLMNHLIKNLLCF